MRAQICTKGKPASVLAHPAGLGGTCLRSTYNIHQSQAGVKRFLARIPAQSSACRVGIVNIFLPSLPSRVLSPEPVPRPGVTWSWGRGQGMRARPLPST
jgi:hypothetical protein